MVKKPLALALFTSETLQRHTHKKKLADLCVKDHETRALTSNKLREVQGNEFAINSMIELQTYLDGPE